MKVIVTGSRKWTDDTVVYDALNDAFKEHGPFMLVHGACSTGADAFAHRWYMIAGQALGCAENRYPANWNMGKGAGPARNVRMVSAGADLVLAFPLPEGSGTQHTIRLAEEAGIPVRRFDP
jgi:hypothetical protein